MIASVETITRHFRVKDTGHCVCWGRCHECGRPLEIHIERTSGGYGLVGGILYEPRPEVILFMCSDCHHENRRRLDGSASVANVGDPLFYTYAE